MKFADHSGRSVVAWCCGVVMLCATPIWTAPAVAQEGLQFDVPSDWTATPTDEPLRLAAYHLPHVSTDSEDATLAVYYFGNEPGVVERHLDRWVSDMRQADDRPSSDVATTTAFDVGALSVTVLDVPGIYAAEVVPASGMRYYKRGFHLRAAVVDTPGGPYFFKLIGPARTVAFWNDAFTAVLESAVYR